MRQSRRQRYRGTGTYQQRQALQRCFQQHLLAAAEPLAAVEAVPTVAVIRQIHRPLTLPRLHHAGYQQIATHHKIIGFVQRALIMLVVEEGRAQHRFVVDAGLPQQGVEIRHQPITQSNRLAHCRRHRRVHPGFVNRGVVVPGVDGETRMHHAILHPTHQQFGVRPVAGEPPHVVPEVVQTGQAHAQPHANVVTQGLPTGTVIAAPGLHITLHTGTAGA